MPLYFFHLRTAQGLSPDELGIELPDVETAYLEAFSTVQDMWADLLRRREDPTRYSFEITDSQGQVIQTLPFSEVLDSTKGYTARRKLPHPARTAQELAEQNSHLYPRDIDTIVNAIFGTIGHALAIRMACESVRCSQELLAASRSNQYRHEHLWQAQPDGEP